MENELRELFKKLDTQLDGVETYLRLMNKYGQLFQSYDGRTWPEYGSELCAGYSTDLKLLTLIRKHVSERQERFDFLT